MTGHGTFHTPYRDYDVLAKWDSPSWNDPTRAAVRERLEAVPPPRFLDPPDYAVLEAVCARMMPQPDRAQPVPIAPWIDDKLARGRSDGYRHASLPPMGQAWRQALRGMEAEAQARFGKGFTDLSGGRQDEILQSVQDGTVRVAAAWQGLEAGRFFSEMLQLEVVAVYYAHPAAWSEIGFGGPASPRGYARLQPGQRDPWEAEEKR